MFEIVEKYITISGEAPILGEPVYLIRFSGCNLDCGYCDTAYKNEVNEKISVEDLKNDIVEKINNYPELKVLLTGGEPLLGDRQEKLIQLIRELKYINFYIETNGSLPINEFGLLNCHYVVDWKSPSSDDENSFCIENVRRMRIDEDCIKFVINRDDFEWLKDAIEVIAKINPFLPLYVSPQWNGVDLSEIAQFILKNKLPLRMSFQFHKIIWEANRRGV